jgi:hypothetical protein
MSPQTQAPAGPLARRTARAQAASARRLRGDMRFVRVYVLATNRIMRYKPHPASVSAPDDPRSVIDRIETGLAEEAHRYRLIAWRLFARSHAATRKLATEYRRLADASAADRPALAEVLSDGAHPRAAFVARHSEAFSAYAELMNSDERA